MQKHWPPFNFSAGPALLPRAVMEQAQSEFLDWQGTGLSVMELSHRGEHFQSIVEQTERDLRQLLQIPDNYRVLFVAGGASFQFAMVPMNLLRQNAVYVDTGIWGSKAVAEAKKFGEVNHIKALYEQQGLMAILDESDWALPENYDYLHFTPNETIGGVEFPTTPSVGRGKLVADMSSNILSRPIDVENYALIYAGAQKNIGPAGLSIVIIREDCLPSSAAKPLPSLMQYSLLAEHQSMYNTPPTYSWYLAGLVFRWLVEQGGVAEMQRRAEQRAQLLYQFIDGSDFYHNPILPKFRSRMNVPFILADESLNNSFIQQAEQAGLTALKGHRSVGGMRASLYNAMPIEGVQALIAFMREFERKA
jgi:phosphoserine aminotransferase